MTSNSINQSQHNVSLIFSELSQLIQSNISANCFSAIELSVVHQSKIVYHQTFGKSAISPIEIALHAHPIWDIASITKLFTAIATMSLVEQHALSLSDRLTRYINEFTFDSEGALTIKHLLNHTSGLPAWVGLFEGDGTTELLDYQSPKKRAIKRQKGLEKLLKVGPIHPPETKVMYSCLGYLYLGIIIERITGKALDDYITDYVLKPLGMDSTGFTPDPSLDRQFVSTEYCDWRKRWLRGEVHDENCAYFGGVAGNAGIFSNADDLMKLAFMILAKGKVSSKALLKESTIADMMKDQTSPLVPQRGLGFDRKSPGEASSTGLYFSSETAGHLGFVGTSFWVDPAHDVAVVCLTNRVHFGRDKTKELIRQFRPQCHDLIMRALGFGKAMET